MAARSRLESVGWGVGPTRHGALAPAVCSSFAERGKERAGGGRRPVGPHSSVAEVKCMRVVRLGGLSGCARVGPAPGWAVVSDGLRKEQGGRAGWIV